MIYAVYAGLIAFGIALLIGPGIIRFLTRMRFGQTVRADGPKEHLKKSGIPTMGGIIMIVAITVASLLVRPKGDLLPWALFATLGFGLIGLVDDSLIIIGRRSLGLRARYKLLGQIILALLLGLYALTDPDLGTSISVPFVDTRVDLGILYVPFAIFVIVGSSNAVNLTDGLDGLAAGTVALAALAYAAISLKLQAFDLAAFSCAIAGACLGFSWFNSHPAQVFMGDTGSLALGAALGSLGVLTKTELSLLIIGGVFVIETLSVILQVLYFRLTHGRRIFRMSPLHHHFELSGWREPKVVVRFWIVGAVFALLGLVGAGVI